MSVRTGGTARQFTGPEWPYRRQLNSVEAKSGVDPLTMDDEVAQIMGDLMTRWPKISAAWRAQLTQQIEQALSADDPTQLTSLSLDASRAGDELTAAVLQAAALGVSTATDEAKSQGVELDDVESDGDALESKARTTAAIMAMGFVASAAREALRLWDTRRDASDVADDVDTHLSSLSDRSVRDTLNGAINGGMNDGRQTAMATADVAVTFYASEIRDANTCDNCLEIDGTEFASQDEADASYPTGGYIDCLGGYRCRGIVVAVYGDSEEEGS